MLHYRGVGWGGLTWRSLQKAALSFVSFQNHGEVELFSDGESERGEAL